MREIHIALKNIDQRTYNEFAVQAQFHGIKIPIKHTNNEAPPQKFNPEDDKKAEEAMKMAIQRHANMRKRRG